MIYQEHACHAPDGVELLVREYTPDAGPGATASRRSLVVVHGAGEHGGRYDRLVREALARGWRVLIPDMRGHGRSAGDRMFIRTFRQFVDDLRLIVTQFNLEPARTALFGHSTGGLIVVRFAQLEPGRVAAVATTAPLLGLSLKVPRRKLWLGQCLARVAPRTRFRSLVQPEHLTNDPAVLLARECDPLIQRHVTCGWFVESHKAIDRAFEAAPQMQVPLLILQSPTDSVIDAAEVARFVTAVGGPDKTLEHIPHGRHELLNELESEPRVQLIFDWLDQRVPGGFDDVDLQRNGDAEKGRRGSEVTS